jgi:uncharacterized protein
MRRAALLALVFAAFAAAARAQAPAPIPPLTGPVVDTAGLLSPQQAAALDLLARELQRKTGAQMALLTLESTGPEDLFDYGMRVAGAWRLGSREKDDGLLLVVARRDRKLRFFSGYGLEGVLPDGKLGRILDTAALPRFRRGELGAGIVEAMQAAASEIAREAGVELTGAPPPAPPPSRTDPLPLAVLLVLVLLVVLLSGSPGGRRRHRRYRPVLWGGGLGGMGSGGFGGGFRGGGGFGGGGGGFGGGGAGRSW